MEQQAAREQFFHTSFFLSALLSCPFHKFLLQFFFAWQVKLVFAGVNVGVFGKSDLDQGRVLFLAQHDADGVVLRLGPDVAVKVVDVHLHLAEVMWSLT